MDKCCGLDVHKDSIFACILDEQGKKILEKRYGTRTPDLTQQMRQYTRQCRRLTKNRVRLEQQMDNQLQQCNIRFSNYVSKRTKSHTSYQWQKNGIPVSSSFKQSVNSITTTGYSSYTAQTYQNMPGHGFDTYHNVNASGKLDMGSSLIFALETGVKWKISSKNYLYTGIYLDYGTTNVWKESAKELLEFNEVSPSDYKYNSILQTDAAYSPKIKEMKTYSIGVKIRLAFGNGKEHERVKRASSSKPPKVKAKPENTPIAPKSGQGKPKPVLE